MERIIATATIGGKTYKLVPKTLKVQEKINSLAELSSKVENGTADYTELLTSQIDFIKSVSDCCIYDNIPIDEIDIDDVTIACIEIMNGYNNKVKQAKTAGFLKSISNMSAPSKKKYKKGKNK